MSEIKCKVEECIHNNDKKCGAREIEVRSCGCKNVSHSDETACETFCRKENCSC